MSLILPGREVFRRLAALGLITLLGFIAPASAWAQTPDSGGFFNAQNTPVNSVLDSYEQLSGKHLIRDVNLNGVPNISINASGLSKAETLKIIEATLLLNGVALVPVDATTMKVVAGGANGRNVRSEGVKLYASAEDLPVADEVVSYYMPLNYISPEEAVQIFTAQAPPHAAYGVYVPAPSAQAVILTENTGVLRQLIALRELIDVPPAAVTSEFVQLTRADATKVAELLTDLIANKSGAGSSVPGGAPSPVAGRLPEAAGPASNEHSLISGSAQIIADTRSNKLLIVTRPVNMPYLRELIRQLDEPDTFAVPERRDLRYVLAQDILPALESALAQGKEEEDQAKQDQGGAASKSATPQQTASSNATTPSSTSSGQGNVQAITPQLESPPENNVPTVVSIGKTRILADNRSNSIIVFGSADATARVFGMVDELDRKPLQVYLATVIGELTVSEGLEFGVDILQKFQHVGTVGISTSNINTPGTTSSASVPEPSGLLSSTGFPILSGLNLYGAIGNTLDYYLRALETTNRFKIISRPSVYTTNNKLAVIASGSEIPVPSNTTSGFTGSDSNLVTTSNIQYQDVLLQLDIIPLINAKHEVTLKIRQTNNSLGASTVISGNSIPAINEQEINTEVTVPDKSTIVIGGLISDAKTRDTGGLPWLSDIPIIGYLFKDVKKTKTRDELIIMIQPTVVETEADQISVNENEKDRTVLGRDADEAATGVVTLPPAGEAHEWDDPKTKVTPRVEPETVATRPPKPLSAEPAEIKPVTNAAPVYPSTTP